MSLYKHHSPLRVLTLALSLALPASLLTYTSVAQADPHHGGSHFESHNDHWQGTQNHWQGTSGHWEGVRDNWHGGFHESHFHPRIGVSINVLPPGHRVFIHGRDRFFFAGGVWYRPFGPQFVVVAPPFGVVIPYLPDDYETRVISNTTYYVADGVYYQVSPQGDGYIVTAPPTSDGTYSQVADKFFVYPRNGQSQERQDKDRYECHVWAMDQSGFDPTIANGGVDPGQVSVKSADYQRAITACLDGRGYTVK